MKKLIILSLAAVLAGCSATPYHKGYGDSQVGENRYRVVGVVDGFSPRSRAESIAILRAAEIACIKKSNGFRVVEKKAIYDGPITHSEIIIELTPQASEYDARFVMHSLSRELEAKVQCQF